MKAYSVVGYVHEGERLCTECAIAVEDAAAKVGKRFTITAATAMFAAEEGWEEEVCVGCNRKLGEVEGRTEMHFCMDEVVAVMAMIPILPVIVIRVRALVLRVWRRLRRRDE